MQRYFLLFLFLTLRLGSLLAAVEVRSVLYTSAEGIASNTIRQVYQDRRGYLWMGTLNGLSRYDGHTFVNYYAGDDQQPALGGHRVANIIEDSNDRLWVITGNNRISCFDPRQDGFIDYTGCGDFREHFSNMERMSNGDIWLWHAQHGCRRLRPTGDTFESDTYSQSRNNLPSGDIHQLKEDAQGQVWLLMDDAAYLIRDGEVVPMLTDKKLTMHTSSHRTWMVSAQGQVYTDADGAMKLLSVVPLGGQQKPDVTGSFLLGEDLYLITQQGGYMYQSESQTWMKVPGLNVPGGDVQRDNRGNYWVNNNTGWVWRIDSDTRQITPLQLIPAEKLSYIDAERFRFVHDQRGIIWITTYGNGLFAYELATGELQPFVADTAGQGVIPSNYLMGVAADRSGGIWVCSEFCGLSRLSVLSEGTTYLYPSGRVSQDDRSNNIRLLTSTDDGRIWVGTRRGGLHVYDQELNLLYKESKHSNVYTVELDTLGRTWLGTRGGGICIDGRWYRHEESDSLSLSGDHLFAIHRDQKGRMWVGVFSGGLDLAERRGEGYIFRHFFNDHLPLKGVRAITNDANGRVWVGTSSGIYIFHPDSLLADRSAYIELSTRNGRLACDEVKAFSQDAQGRMWIATSGAGLAMIDLSKGDYHHLEPRYYDTSNGLVNNMVQAVTCTPAGTIWVTTEYGASSFRPANGVFENYFFSTSVMGNTYSDNCAELLPDGRLLLGSNDGLVVVQPDIAHLRWSAQTPPVVFTSLKVNGTVQHPGTPDSPLQEAVAYTRLIELSYRQNSIEVDFTVFDYSREGTVRYSYKLDNYDKAWSTPSTRPYAAYKNLSPGRYVLRVKASTAGGQWGNQETILAIRVKPPFWQTSWAILCYLLAGSALCYFLWHLLVKFNTLRNRIEVERQLTEYKLIFFTNISHEFRTPLTLIQSALEKLHQHPHDTAYALKVLDKSTQRMLRLINQLLEFRKMQNNKLSLSLEQTDVVAFISDIFQSFQEAAQSKQMDYRFECSLPSYQMFVDKGYLDKVAYNLLSNAFKYTTSAGTIVLSMEVDETANLWRMSVTDTGVGVPREQQGELFQRFMQSSFSSSSVGVGLHLTHELVLVHHGTIAYAEHQGGGSIFTVTLPTDASVYEEKDFLVPNKLLEEEEEHEKWKKEEEHLNMALEQEWLAGKPLNQRKVLIIEDDNDVRDFLRCEIGQYFEVDAEVDGKAGLEKARTSDVDLIVCDVMMPGMDGFEVTRRLKQDFATSHIPIILLTALDDENKQLEGLKTGADAYITKPFSPRLLMARIVKLIEGRERLREKFAGATAEVRPAICSTDQDREFADRLQLVMEKQMDNAEFTIDDFAAQMKLGRTMFYRKVRGVTGYSPNEYMRIMRMKKAAEYLSSGENLTVAEVSYRVGLNDPFYFSKCFKQQFGVSPSAYQKGERAKAE